MKEFLFKTYDLGADKTVTYKIKADNIEDAQNMFKCKCIPLFCDDFKWTDMVHMFMDCDITIDVIEVDKIIDL